MHGNQLVELSFIDNYSWKKLSLDLIEEVARLQQEEYMLENWRGKKYFLMNLDIRRKNGSVTKIWFCKAMSKKRGWKVTKSPSLNPHLLWAYLFSLKLHKIFRMAVQTAMINKIMIKCWSKFQIQILCCSFARHVYLFLGSELWLRKSKELIIKG